MSADPITAALEIGTSIIKRIWPDPADQAKHSFRIQQLAQDGKLEELQAEVQLLVGQMEINKAEAASGNWFASSWRPFTGWTCALGLFYVSIVEPIIRIVAEMNGYTGEFPVIDTTITMQVLMGMLGLGIMRTREKEKGVNS